MPITLVRTLIFDKPYKKATVADSWAEAVKKRYTHSYDNPTDLKPYKKDRQQLFNNVMHGHTGLWTERT